jgi:hypothetical protein
MAGVSPLYAWMTFEDIEKEQMLLQDTHAKVVHELQKHDDALCSRLIDLKDYDLAPLAFFFMALPMVTLEQTRLRVETMLGTLGTSHGQVKNIIDLTNPIFAQFNTNQEPENRTWIVNAAANHVLHSANLRRDADATLKENECQ